MVQNHIPHVPALVAIDAPASLNPVETRAADELIAAGGGGQWLDATDLVKAEARL